MVELATELNATVDYLLGNSDINLLDTSKKDIQILTKEEAMKVLVIKQFLKKQKKNEKNDSSNP